MVVVADCSVKLPPQTFGHLRQNRLLVARVLLFFTLEGIWQKLIMVLGLLIRTTNGANGRNVESVLLQPTHRSYLLKKKGSARKSGGDVQERTRIVPTVTSQAGKVDVMTIAKLMRGINLPVPHNGN